MTNLIHRILLLGLLLSCGFVAPTYAAQATKESGTQRTFWVWNLNVMPPSFRKATTTLRAEGSRSLIYVEDSLWESNVPEKFVDNLSQRLEIKAKDGAYLPNRGVVPAEEEIFAPLPRVVNPDPRLIVLFADLGQYKNYRFDGFFNVFDQLTESVAWSRHQQHSNEANIIYINGIRETELYTEGVIAHELQHLLAHHASGSTQFQQELWLSETLAEGAMLLTGYYTDQGHVERYLQDPAAYSLVSHTYVQYGPQLLFASFLIDTLKRTGAFGPMTRSSLPGKEAIVEAFRSRAGGALLSFDAIYSLFLTYLSDNILSGAKLPYSWQHSEETGLALKNLRTYGKISVPGSIEGSLVPYSFAPYTLSENLTETSGIHVEIVNATGTCAEGKGSVLWKPLSSRMIAVYAIGCDKDTKEDAIHFRLSISEQPEISPLSTIPFFRR